MPVTFKYFDFFKNKKLGDWMRYIDVIAEVEYNAIKQVQYLNFVLDRFFVSSLIYNKVYERKYDVSYINPLDFKQAITIFVDTPLEVLIERSKQRADDQKIIDRLEILSSEYKEYFSTYKYDLTVIDGSVDVNDNVEMLTKIILKYFR